MAYILLRSIVFNNFRENTVTEANQPLSTMFYPNSSTSRNTHLILHNFRRIFWEIKQATWPFFTIDASSQVKLQEKKKTHGFGNNGGSDCTATTGITSWASFWKILFWDSNSAPISKHNSHLNQPGSCSRIRYPLIMQISCRHSFGILLHLALISSYLSPCS